MTHHTRCGPSSPALLESQNEDNTVEVRGAILSLQELNDLNMRAGTCSRLHQKQEKSCVLSHDLDL